MSIIVPYLPDADIEAEATALLKSFECKYGKIETAATPLDEIIETHLGLGFEIADLGHPAILGQLDVRQNLIRINSVLDPHENPKKEGRYNYTLAHEGGHHVLHRQYAEALMELPSLFNETEEEKNVILCRREDQKSPVEIQADKFASYLLLPKDKVIAEFMGMYGGKKFVPEQQFIQALRCDRDFLNQEFHNPHYVPSDEDMLHHAFKGFADLFRVSMKATVIRLKRLGIIGVSPQENLLL